MGGTCLHRGCIPAKELLETRIQARPPQTDEYGRSCSMFFMMLDVLTW